MKQKNVRVKKVLTQIGAVLILAVTIYFLSSILGFKSPHGIDQLEGLYWQPQESMNVVVMGTGEPFDNYENLSKFIRIINDKNGRNLGMRNITVSTCGLVPMIETFAKDFPQVNLAISLHAPNNDIRNSMMPVNKKYPMEVLIEACKKYTEETSRRITFEYTLVKDKNDSRENAFELIEKLRGVLCHVNLIPLNKVEETGLDTSERKACEAVKKILEDHGIPATIRRELGDDIDGACGQLRLGGKK